MLWLAWLAGNMTMWMHEMTAGWRMSQLDDFNSIAQSGQQLSREELWPAEILLSPRQSARR